MRVCTTLFCAIIIPSVTFCCKHWAISAGKINMLQGILKYASSRFQPSPARSPTDTSYEGPGWMDLEIYIMATWISMSAARKKRILV